MMGKAGGAENIECDRAEPRCKEGAGETGGQRNACDQTRENNAEREKTDDRLSEELERGEKGDEKNRDRGNGAEKTRPRDHTAHPIGCEGAEKLQNAHHHHQRHADFPGEDFIARCHHHGAQHAEGEPEQARGVDAEGHGRDVFTPLPARQAHRHPGVDQIAQKNADRRARDDSEENDLPRKTEDVHEDSGQDHDLGHVVEHEPEKRVYISACNP